MSIVPPPYRRPQTIGFDGIPAAAFAFFAALAQDNTRRWFTAHAETYRVCVDRPWRALIAAVAARVGDTLPDLDTEVKTGHVLSRINLQWPRPGAAYRTGLRAAFAAPEAGRRPGACLFVSLDASGVRAGAEVAAGSPEWERVLQGMDSGSGQDAGGLLPAVPAAPPSAGLRWTVAGQALEAAAGADIPGAEIAGRMRAVQRAGGLRLAEGWSADDAAVGTPPFADAVWEAVRGALPLYLRAAGVLGPTADAAVDGPGPMPGSDGVSGADTGPGATQGMRGERAGSVRRIEAEITSARAAMEASGLAAGAASPVPAAAEFPSGGTAALRRPHGAHARPAGYRAAVSAPEALSGAPPLPRSLQRALAARAEAEGVAMDAFIVFALTQAAADPGMGQGRDRPPTPGSRRA